MFFTEPGDNNGLLVLIKAHHNVLYVLLLLWPCMKILCRFELHECMCALIYSTLFSKESIFPLYILLDFLLALRFPFLVLFCSIIGNW